MTTELWARVRRLFFKPDHSKRLGQVLAGWSADHRTGDFGPAVKRELFHPLKGWLPENAERAPGGPQARRRFRHPADGRTGGK